MSQKTLDADFWSEKFSRRQALSLTAASLVLAGCAARDEATVEERYPPLGRFVEVEGARIHLLETQSPSADAPTVVLIHGANGNLRDFTFDFVQRLAPRYRVVAVDRPGLGHSDRSEAEDAHRPDVQARLLRAATAAVGVERAIVVGHSFGAAPALAWALDAPETVLGVVSLAGATHPFPGSVGLVYELGATPVIGGIVAAAAGGFLSEDRAKEAVKRIFRPQEPPEGYTEYVGVGLALRPRTLRSSAQDLANLNVFLTQQRTRYPLLSVPVEIVHGAADRIVSVNVHGDNLAKEAPRARLTTLPGVGHMPHHAAPEECVAAIDRLATV